MDSVLALRFPVDLFQDVHQAQTQEALGKAEELMEVRELFLHGSWCEGMSTQAQTVMSLILEKTINFNLIFFRNRTKQPKQKIKSQIT